MSWARLAGPEENRRIEGVVVDVSDLRRAEADRERLTSAIEQAAEAVLITDAAGTILYVNPAFENVTGYSRDEAIGRNPRFLKSGEHDQAFYRNMWGHLELGQDLGRADRQPPQRRHPVHRRRQHRSRPRRSRRRRKLRRRPARYHRHDRP